MAIVDRYCRTIREIIQRYFTAYGTTKWYTRLQDFTDNINDTINSTIKNTPNDIWYGREINEQDLTDETIKLNVGTLLELKITQILLKENTPIITRNRLYNRTN